jgi:hypothetical protein
VFLIPPPDSLAPAAAACRLAQSACWCDGDDVITATVRRKG